MVDKVVEDSFPGIVFHQDGLSVTRAPSPAFPEVAASNEPVEGIVSKDVVVNESLGISVRAYFPAEADEQQLQLLPVLVYCHGGGFILFSCKSLPFHKLCEKLSRQLNAVVLAVEYRLAPEHRLPAAYDDAFHVLTWLDAASKPAPAASTAATATAAAVPAAAGSDFNLRDWLKDHADFSKVFLAGDSAGGNIAYHVARKWCSGPAKMRSRSSNKTLTLVGLVLIQPFFGGASRMDSELKFAAGPVITLDTSDICWKYALPQGTDRDHPFCNVFKNLEGVADLPSVLVAAGGRDLLHDRQVQLVNLLQQEQKDVVFVEYENVGHAFYMLLNSPEASLLFDNLLAFWSKCTA